MTVNKSTQNSNTLTDAEQLIYRIAKDNPDPDAEHDEKWIDNKNISIQTDADRSYKLYCEVKRYIMYCERTALIGERKYYALVSRTARNILCKTPDEPENTDRSDKDPLTAKVDHDAVMLIADMHKKWMNGKDLSIFIPTGLDPQKKKIIENHLQKIEGLNLEDESEGTLAYLLLDYCRTMILYNCALQFAYGNTYKTLSNVYGEYAAEAKNLFSRMIDQLMGGDEED